MNLSDETIAKIEAKLQALEDTGFKTRFGALRKLSAILRPYGLTHSVPPDQFGQEEVEGAVGLVLFKDGAEIENVSVGLTWYKEDGEFINQLDLRTF